MRCQITIKSLGVIFLAHMLTGCVRNPSYVNMPFQTNSQAAQMDKYRSSDGSFSDGRRRIPVEVINNPNVPSTGMVVNVNHVNNRHSNKVIFSGTGSNKCKYVAMSDDFAPKGGIWVTLAKCNGKLEKISLSLELIKRSDGANIYDHTRFYPKNSTWALHQVSGYLDDRTARSWSHDPF